MDRSFRQLDMLDDVKIAGRRQPEPLDFAIVNFTFDGLINTLRWQWLTQLSLVSGLAAPLRLLSASRFLLGLGLGNVTRRWLGRSGRILLRLGEFQFQLRNPSGLLLQLSCLLGNKSPKVLDDPISIVHRGTIAKSLR